MKRKTAKVKRTRAAVRRATVPPKREFPSHLGTTPEEWRNKKRTEWREVMQAIERYEYGSAYTPANSALYHLHKLAYQISDALEPTWEVW